MKKKGQHDPDSDDWDSDFVGSHHNLGELDKWPDEQSDTKSPERLRTYSFRDHRPKQQNNKTTQRKNFDSPKLNQGHWSKRMSISETHLPSAVKAKLGEIEKDSVQFNEPK